MRLLAKTLTWRVVAVSVSIALVLAATGSLAIAGAVGLLDMGIKSFLYYGHEKLWKKIKWLKPRGKVVWLTGLSGSGKTTLANAYAIELRKRGRKAEILDGDELRKRFPGTGFSKDDRVGHGLRVAFMASKLASHGVVAIVSLISPYRSIRRIAAETAEQDNNDFYQVFVDAPLEVCEERDPKGLYRKVRRGEIKNFTGISDPYERPLEADLTLRTNETPLKDCVKELLKLTR